ncbi:hypothetical protein [Bacillus sp. FJAT-50079]|uniref:hypothetical protein n=1 Tax=Bacillus sp. FJAT-50079 TaxID=2833577 RepID=UPI001BC90EEF|nr:hypothetical protein [Bacillus sp. FJAT-50079]MBS4208546.1 hypothetical protein [Bacillus sp. FJAT-50079]
MYYYRGPNPNQERFFPFLFGAPLIGGFFGGLLGGGLVAAAFSRPRPYPYPYPYPYPPVPPGPPVYYGRPPVPYGYGAPYVY